MSHFFVSLILIASILCDDGAVAATAVVDSPLEAAAAVNDELDFDNEQIAIDHQEVLEVDADKFWKVDIDKLSKSSGRQQQHHNNQRDVRDALENQIHAAKDDNTPSNFPMVVERFSRAIASEISRRLPFQQLQLQPPLNLPFNLPWLSWKKSSNYQVYQQNDVDDAEVVMLHEPEELEERTDAKLAGNRDIHNYHRRERWIGAWCPPELLDAGDDDSNVISNAGEDNGVLVDKSLTLPYFPPPLEVSSNDNSGEDSNNNAMFDKPRMDGDDVQPGMVVFVFPREEDSGVVGVGKRKEDGGASQTPREGFITSILDASTDTDEMAAEEEDPGAGVDNITSGQSKCLQYMGQQYNHDTRVAQYALIRREPLELGIVDVHRHDFAYQPVALTISQGEWTSSAKNDDTGRSSDSRELQTVSKQSYDSGDQQVSYRWFSWVTHIAQLLHGGSGSHTMVNVDGNNGLLGSSSDLNYQTPLPYQSNIYEEDGKRPFAGGSHGEIWRARRRCPIILGSDEYNDSMHENPTTSSSSSCDADRDLIVKRLKIEFGYPVLEAGLREIYFGELLAREVESSGLFTSYVDHFFREGKRGQVELWIVFENAGSSLRSFLYTPVDTGGYLVFQHSAFWRKLRRGIAGGRHQDDESLVIFHPNRNRYSERASPAGRELLRGEIHSFIAICLFQCIILIPSHMHYRSNTSEVLKQLISSVEFLHKRGIVHR